MAPRPHWKGYLKLSFVTCPILLYPAVSPAERISFRQVNRGTGNRLRQQMVDSVTGEVVDALDKARGYEVGENHFLVVEDQEIAEAKEEAKSLPFIRPPEYPRETSNRRGQERRDEPARTIVEAPPLAPAPELAPPQRKPVSRTIEIDRFVPLRDLDARYFEKPYYIVPNGSVAEEAYTVIREAMSGKEVAALGHVVLSSRERPIAIHPLGVGLQGMTLRYPYEVRNEAEYFADVPSLALPKDMLELASHIVDTMQADFDPKLLNDRERAAVVDMLNEKQRALPQIVRKAAAPSPKNVVNLMDALKRSVAAAAVPPRRPKTESQRRRKPARQ